MASCESSSDGKENIIRGVRPHRFEPVRSINAGEEQNDLGE